MWSRSSGTIGTPSVHLSGDCSMVHDVVSPVAQVAEDRHQNDAPLLIQAHPARPTGRAVPDDWDRRILAISLAPGPTCTRGSGFSGTGRPAMSRSLFN